MLLSPSQSSPCPTVRRSSPPGRRAKANWPTATTRASGASSCAQPVTTAARERIWQELCDLLAVDGDAAFDLDPATVDLYRVLSTPMPVSADVVVLQEDDDVILPTRQAV